MAIPRDFNLRRTLVSVTTDRAEALNKFAGENGTVYSGLASRLSLIPQTLEGAGESEYLLRYGASGFGTALNPMFQINAATGLGTLGNAGRILSKH